MFYIEHLALGHTEESSNTLNLLQQSWPHFALRQEVEEDDWVDGLGKHLLRLADSRIAHVMDWLNTNTSRFNSDIADFGSLHREFESLAVALTANVQLCQLKCAECNLTCLQGKHHEGSHDCNTSHACARDCNYKDEHKHPILCGLP